MLICALPGYSRCRDGRGLHHHLSRWQPPDHGGSTLRWGACVSGARRVSERDLRQLWTRTGQSDVSPRSSRVEPTQEGDYEICFDNSFSRFSEKMVFFEIILEGQGGDVGGDEEWVGLEEPEGSLLEYKLEDIRVSCLLGLCVFLNSCHVCGFTERKMCDWWMSSDLWHVQNPSRAVLCGEQVQELRWCYRKGQTHSTEAEEVGMFERKKPTPVAFPKAIAVNRKLTVNLWSVWFRHQCYQYQSPAVKFPSTDWKVH